MSIDRLRNNLGIFLLGNLAVCGCANVQSCSPPLDLQQLGRFSNCVTIGTYGLKRADEKVIECEYGREG